MTRVYAANRRAFLQLSGLGLTGLFGHLDLRDGRTLAAEPAKKPVVSPIAEPLNRFPRIMQEWLNRQVREIEAHANLRRAALKTKADAEAYVRSARERIRECFGPEPVRTPLGARITGVIERETYRIEKVIFASRPGFLVTANLYLPKGRSGRLPSVLVACGHSENGKCAEAENAIAQNFARMGYVALIFDPPGQGERYLYLDPNDRLKSRYNYATFEHAQAGNQQVLVGESASAWFAWDGIRALDYLLSRPEVDPNHVGITGNSGGGMETTFLCGLESRFTMAAPSGWVTTIRRNAENELTQDTEQCPARVLAMGLDHSDFLAAFAPKPIVIQAQQKDFFDVRGSQEAFARLQKLYTLLGKPENIELNIGPNYHSYPRASREVTYRLFNRATGVTAATDEMPITIEKDETLACTAQGNVAFENSRSIYSFTREKSEQLAKSRPRLTGRALQDAAQEVLKLPAVQGVPDYSILRNAGRNRYASKGFCTYAIETEPGIYIPATRLFDDQLTSPPPTGSKQAVLYVSHQSADVEMRDDPFVQEFMQRANEVPFYGCDVRGVGESRPNIGGVGGRLRLPFDADYFFASNSLMLDRPYLGQKAFDVIRVLDWLRDQGHTEVHLVAQGWGALAATFAALLNPTAVQVTLKHPLQSFATVAETEDYRWPYAMLLPGVLLHFDLPDCYRELASRQLKLIEPWGALDGLG
jgi:dienelactone hydrolase